MTIEEHIENLKAIASDMPSDKCSDWIESLMAGVKALEQQPCEDCISRESIIEIVNHQRFGMSKLAFGIIAEKVKELPPVTPQPKMGRWKRISMDKYSEHAKYWYRCDRCGKDNLGNTDYCPNCGQPKMQEVKE